MLKKTLKQREIEVNREEKSWEVEKTILEREQFIKKEKRDILRKKINIPTSKLLILFLFINCTIIELFTGWVTIQSFVLANTRGFMPDFTPLVTLIGAVVGEVVGYGVYSLKSMKENTEGGIIYQNMMNNNISIEDSFKEDSKE